jgi:N-acyl amino acid synthase of PEP-CTERM/exosortase system
MEANNRRLSDSFLRYFAPEVASTPQALKEAFELRYQVYCEEFAYESAREFSERAEHDLFDSHSISFLVRHITSGHVAGCIRVVLAGEDQPLPLEAFCLHSIHPRYREILNSSRSHLCEYSRLAVSSDFRRRPRESLNRLGLPKDEVTPEEERSFPLIAVAAFLGAFAVTELIGRNQVFAMMEPFLPRMLKRSGIEPETAGDAIDYHGTRSAYYITTQSAVENLNPDLLALYEAIKGTVAEQDMPVVG